MYRIHSTYDEWAPQYDDFPAGRAWGEYASAADAWAAVRAYLLLEQNWHPAGDGLAPFGHEQPTAFPRDLTIQNDAETIEIQPV